MSPAVPGSEYASTLEHALTGLDLKHSRLPVRFVVSTHQVTEVLRKVVSLIHDI